MFGLVAIALVLTPAASSAKVPKEFFGVAMGGPTDTADYKAMKKIKVRTMRMSLPWSRVEPRRGEFQWPDGRILALAEHGIRPVLTVYGAPSWAVHSQVSSTPPVKGKAKKAYKKFLKKAVRRYKPHGVLWRKNADVKAKPVKSWQIWNEPNLPKYFNAKHVPRTYAKLVKTSDKAIGKADKHAKVILAGLSGNPKKKKMAPQRFLKKFLRVHKVKKHFSAAALHPYATSIKNYKKRIKKTRKALKKMGAGKKGLWLTELGWGSGPRDRFHLNKGLHGQAKMLKKSFSKTLHKRRAWKIKRAFWFDWRDYSANRAPCSFCPYAGLVREDRSAKPALKKFRHFTRRAHRHRHHH